MIRSRCAAHGEVVGELQQCFTWCARPTEGRHVRTTHDLAQPLKG